jgi:hypothetical protein
MRTRIATISIEENNDGRKRTVGQRYPADGLLLMDPQTAGQGFLKIVGDLVAQLDGVPAQAPAPAPAPAPIPQVATARVPKPKPVAA